MSTKRISEIRAWEPPKEIRIRVIKRWIPHFKKEDLCYLFVDIHGDAIEASADSTKEMYFDSMIKVNSCYAVSGYVSTEAKNYMVVVAHKVSIRIGERAVFVPIQETNIPTYYYNFASYALLEARVNDPKLLTDYIGRIEKISEVLVRREKKLRKVTILDTSKNLIEITFWTDKINEVNNKDAVGKVLAVTSTMVTKFIDKLQLESTSATTVDINPPIPSLDYYINRFKEIDETSNVIITLADLLSKGTEDNMQNRATCLVSVTSTDMDWPWYYVTCNKCKKKAHPET